MRSQQHHWNSRNKRLNVKSWRNEKTDSAIDGSNSDHVKLLLEDLKTKYDQMTALLKAELVDTKMQQEEALSAGLMKLPKSIRQMSVREFNRSYKCDILSLLKSKDGVKEVKAMAAHIKTFKDKYLCKGQRRRRNNQPGEAVCEGSTESW